MHTRIPAGPRRRTRRALLAAALPLVAAAAALPSAAQANSVSLGQGLMSYTQTLDQASAVTTQIKGGNVHIRSSGGVQQIFNSACTRVDSSEVRCPGGSVQRITLVGGIRSDTYVSNTSLPTLAIGLAGNDSYLGGAHPQRNRVEFSGGPGIDTVSYAFASSGVNVSKDERANDGRFSFDLDNIRSDVERLSGSAHGDILGGSNSAATEYLEGGFGNDTIRGNGGPDVFDTASIADGADLMIGGAGHDSIRYFKRTRPVMVNLSAGGADDGEVGERDELREIEAAAGGSAGDTLKAPANAPFRVSFHSGAGDDRLTGTNFDGPCCAGDDVFHPGPGRDTVTALAGDDTINSVDREVDTISCGSGFDGGLFDLSNPSDLMTGCENVQVGTLELAPKAVAAKAGKPARVRLSWRHPRAWRKLRAIELSLQHDELEAGAVSIRPKRGTIAVDGAVELIRRGSRITRNGKTVTARLALRVHPSLAGETLDLDVTAVDTRGRRQLERHAGTIELAP